jgi:hypothetical protein
MGILDIKERRKIMGTRSNIAIEDKETKNITVVYCHWDGYLEGVGAELLEQYDSLGMVEELIRGGDMSSLGSHYAQMPDRKEPPYSETWENNKPKTYQNEYTLMIDLRGDVFIEYIYLFRDGKWFVSELIFKDDKDAYRDFIMYHTKFKCLETELKKLRKEVA